MTRPAVSVVIPTTGRAELPRALESVRSQTFAGSIEAIVVVDSHEPLPSRVTELADVILYTSGGQGAPAARNLGVKSARGDWLAFLDDDDVWEAQKIQTQVAILGEQETTIVGSRHRHVASDGGSVSGPLPRQVIHPDERIEDYLFRRRIPAAGRASMYTSTLICSTTLARRVPWDETLRRHQDWDWLIRANREAHAIFIQVPEPLAVIQVGTEGSISASDRWEESLAWGATVLAASDPHTLTDFVTAQSLRYAVSARSLRGIVACLRVVVSARRVPSLGPALIAIGGLLPRRTIQRILTRAATRV